MKKFSQKHLLGIKDITADDIQLVFETADNFKSIINRPIKKVPSLRDITIANVFFEERLCANENVVIKSRYNKQGFSCSFIFYVVLIICFSFLV